MTVHFIGAGPGAPDLLTLRGHALIARCPVCLYAGSLVPKEVIEHAPPDARVLDTAPMTLDEIIAEMQAAHTRGQDVARVHTGDPSLYGAIGEQMRRLDDLEIPYDVTPGVPAYTAAAATLRRELTLPGVAQTVILTRMAGKTPMPPDEDLENLARTRATLAIHLSVGRTGEAARILTPFYGPDCPVAVVHRASWPDEYVLRGTLADIGAKVEAAGITKTALILVGRVLGTEPFDDSVLYGAAKEWL